MVKSTVIASVLLSVSACAHHGAVRATCEGALRPVNAPLESHEPPVTVAPSDPKEPKTPEARP